MILKSLGWTSAITGAGALLITLMLLFGWLTGQFDGPSGMAIVALGIWPVFLSVVGLIAGFIAYFIASGARVALPSPGKVGLWTAGTAASVLALALMVG